MSTDTLPSSKTKVSEWVDYHDLLAALLPFGYRDADPIDQFVRLSEGVADLPNTAATFKTSDILGEKEAFDRGFAASTHVETMFRILGAFKHSETSTGWRWSNPNYIHGSVHREPWGSTAERVAFAREVAALGTVEWMDVARRFGVEKQTLTYHFDKAGFDWPSARDKGKARLARTVETAYAWTDREYREITDPLPISYSAFNHWRRDLVADDFEPPADPTRADGMRRWRPSRVGADE